MNVFVRNFPRIPHRNKLKILTDGLFFRFVSYEIFIVKTDFKQAKNYVFVEFTI